MHKMFRKDQIFTIPNLLSLFRILLIPVIVVLYFTGNYYFAIGVIALSAITDIVDGKIARKFNMVSDFGKILDPIADKFTQGTLMLCLISRYKMMIILVIVLVVKEFITSYLGYLVIKKTDLVNTAKWYGKLATVVLYLSMAFLILYPNTRPESPIIANILIAVCIAVIVLAMAMYSSFYIKRLREYKNKEQTIENDTEKTDA